MLQTQSLEQSVFQEQTIRNVPRMKGFPYGLKAVWSIDCWHIEFSYNWAIIFEQLTQLFGFLAFYNGYCAAGETNDMERKKLFSKAVYRYIASIIFVSFGALYEMFEENYGLDFNVTSRGGHGFSMEAHTV